MKQYQAILQHALDNGTWQENRTDIRTKMVPGMMFQWDMRDGFPAVTTKRLAWKQVVGELLGFLRGASTVTEFNALGCTVWDANGAAWDASGRLGRIYGVQWSDWGGELDQMAHLLDTVRRNPTSRRMIVTAWNPLELEQMSLPPCHYSFQVVIEQSTQRMHLLWNQRSADMFLGLPFNIASYGLLLHILAAMTGYIPGTLTGFLADVHIYENHLDQVATVLEREPYAAPTLWMNDAVPHAALSELQPEWFMLDEYAHHGAVPAPMAV